MTPVRLEPAALRSRVKHSTTEPLRSLIGRLKTCSIYVQFYASCFETLHMFGHGLKMCMWFEYYLQIILAIFSLVEQSRFRHL